MRFLDLIEAKKNGAELSGSQLREGLRGYVQGSVPDYQMAALLMAIRWRGLNDREAGLLTEAMVASGERYDLTGLPGPIVDKHSTGGVGDKVSLVLAPLAASCGCTVPMVSGRGLGHSGGTLDKLESIPGLRTDLSRDAFISQLRDIGVAMGAQTETLVPADRKLYALRDVTATVDEAGLMIASILSKKIAEGTHCLVLDVKFGAGAFVQDPGAAASLADRLCAVAQGAGLTAGALLTDMEQPLGLAVGNALEVRESIDCLRGEGPADLRALALELAAEMLHLGGLAASPSDGRQRAAAALDDGSALRKFRELVRAQGGDPAIVDDPARLPRSPSRFELQAPESGYVHGIHALKVGQAAVALRAGRDTREARIDPGAGVLLGVRPGDQISAGATWVTGHHGPDADVDRAVSLLRDALAVSSVPPVPRPLILERRP